MSHAVRRQLFTAAVAASSLALVAAPTAGAKTSKPEQAQNTAIRKVTKTAKKAAKDATKGIADAKSASVKAKGAQDGVNTVLAGVPQILDGLKKLADGLTAAAAGLTKLGDAFAAQEYGTVKLQLGTTDVPGAVFNSSDIPDDSNAAILTATAIVPVPDGAANVPIRLLAGVRSGEADGTGPADPVASAGIVSMTATGQTTLTTVSGGNSPLTGVPITSKANAAASGAPVYPIPLKAPRADATPNPFSFPTEKAIDLTDATTLQNFGVTPGPFTVSNSSGATGVVTVTFTVRFNDLTASATDVTA
jgi:X-X-X-Leu-X-X-Gly heptad repeat protein